MSPKVCIPLANGSEELEAVSVINVLRRGGVNVTVCSVQETLRVTCAQKTSLVADCFIKDCVDTIYDFIILPGGLPGAEHLRDNELLIKMLRDSAKAGRYIAAICASPAFVLSHHGLLKGEKATCYPAMMAKLEADGAIPSEDSVVVSNKFVTSRGPGTAIQFALKILELLDKDWNKVASDMLVSL